MAVAAAAAAAAASPAAVPLVASSKEEGVKEERGRVFPFLLGAHSLSGRYFGV